MSDESKSKRPRAVEIEAEVRQIKTMADGTVNLTLNSASTHGMGEGTGEGSHIRIDGV